MTTKHNMLMSAAAGLMAQSLAGHAQQQRDGIEEVSATKRYASAKLRGTVRCNHRHRANLRAKARRDAPKVPAYTIQQHDALVRKHGARKARVFERRILDRDDKLTFAEALG